MGGIEKAVVLVTFGVIALSCSCVSRPTAHGYSNWKQGKSHSERMAYLASVRASKDSELAKYYPSWHSDKSEVLDYVRATDGKPPIQGWGRGYYYEDQRHNEVKSGLSRIAVSLDR